MSQDITGTGLVVSLIASKTYPAGISLTNFADDADPFDPSSIRIADVSMGLNGDLITWSKAVPLPVVLNFIPGSPDDLNLAVLADANRVGQGKASANDIITITVLYPDGSIITYTGGKLTDAMFGKGVSSAGRLKSKPYAFAFEKNIGA